MINRFMEEHITPYYAIDKAKLRSNCEILAGVQERTGCRILLAQKAFSAYDTYPLIAEYLCGTEASGLYEAKLGHECMPNKECHVFSAAFRDDEIEEIFENADHIVFNSPSQLARYGSRAKAQGLSVGLRINPECSTQEGHEIYDPCARGSRLGTTRQQWDELMSPELINILDGIHFHTLCEQGSEDLETTVEAVIRTFGDVLKGLKWINLGGGHHITKKNYNISKLEGVINQLTTAFGLMVYLEPGEAVALDAGYLVTSVLDIVQNADDKIAILDMSAACHAPDVIEMPYQPPLYKASTDNGAYGYILAGPTCLAGDVVGRYFFENELKIGQRLAFEDMAIYSMCKNNTFNGMKLPDICLIEEDGKLTTLKSFGYQDFKYRLGM